MDNVLLFTPSKKSHMRKLKDLLKALLKNGLKISPRKYQLFKEELQYMGNKIFIQEKRVFVKPLHSRLEAIQKLKPPTTVKGCRSFAGMVNFLSIFCQDLQKLLKPIYDLMRKGRSFIWEQEQQVAFEEIKKRLQKPPILHLPDNKGRFHLYSDTSKHATGSALYQMQNGKPKLIPYASTRLPEAAQNYSITESEMCGLAINIASFSHLLKTVDFDAVVDHLALVHILKCKTEPATTRIKRLLEVLSAYSFNLYYMKGKDMILSDFLSRQRVGRSNPHEIIPISFDMKAILNDKYYNVGKENRYLVQTQPQSKDTGTKVPEVHGAEKGIDPDLTQEWIVRKSQKLVVKPKLEQDRVDPSIQKQTQVTGDNHVKDQLMPEQRKNVGTPQVEQNTSTSTSIEQGRYITPTHLNRSQAGKIQTPNYPEPVMKPQPRPPDKMTQNDRQIKLDLDLEINQDMKRLFTLPYRNVCQIIPTYHLIFRN